MKSKQKTIYFEPEKFEQLKQEAKQLGMTMTGLIMYRLFSKTREVRSMIVE